MKKAIFFILFTLPFLTMGQYLTTAPEFGSNLLTFLPIGTSYDYTVVSKYDTTVLYTGNAKCDHNFVAEKGTVSNTTCAVYHGNMGCPSDWLNQKEICTICLFHIQVRETRDKVEPKDEYKEALERLNKFKNN